MEAKEATRLKTAIRNHKKFSGDCRHIFLNFNYACILQKEIGCTEVDLARSMGIAQLVIVDGLKQDFKIVS